MARTVADNDGNIANRRNSAMSNWDDCPGSANIFQRSLRRSLLTSIRGDLNAVQSMTTLRDNQLNQLSGILTGLNSSDNTRFQSAAAQATNTEFRLSTVQIRAQDQQTITESSRHAQAQIQLCNTTETVLRTTRDGLVIAGAAVATVATAGAAAPLLGTVAAGVIGVGAGTAAGTTIGALSNTAEATGHIALGNMSAEQAIQRAVTQTGRDFQTSAITAGSTALGWGVGGALVRAGGGQAASMTTRVLSGAAAGGTGATAGTGTHCIIDRVGAENQFAARVDQLRAQGRSEEQIEQARQNFLRERGVTTEQMLWRTGTAAVIGTVTGGAGARFGAAAQNATQAGNSTIGIRAGEIAFNSAAGLTIAAGSNALDDALGVTGTNYTERGYLSWQDAYSTVFNTTVGTVTGNAVANPPGGPRPQTLREALTPLVQTPTFNRLFSRTQPPPVPGTNPALGTAQQPTHTQQPTTTTVPHSELPPSIRNSNAFRYANGNTRAPNGQGNRTPRSVAVEVDSNLPRGARPQAEVVVDPRTGARTTRIRLDQQTYQRLQSGDPRALQRFQHELRHANRSNLVDVHVRDGNGNITRTRSAREYVALRALEEFQVRAGRGTGEGPNNPNVGHVREVQRLIASGDHIGAIRYARQNGIAGGDLRNYGQNYATNRANPNQLVQRGNAIDEATALLEQVSSSHGRDEIRAALELAPNDTVRLAILDNLVQRIQANPSPGLRNSQTKDLTTVAGELGLNQQLSQVFQQRGVGSVRRNPTTSPTEETPTASTRRTVPDVNRAKEILTEIGCTFPGGRLRSAGRSENGSPVYEVIAPDGRRLFISYDQGSGNTNRNGELQQHNGGTWKLMREVSDRFFNRDRNIVLDENLNPIPVNQPNQPE